MLTGQIFLQMIVILVVVQLFGFLSKYIGQQWVIGEILAGLALGPSLLGVLAPGVKAYIFPTSVLPTLQTLGDIGLVLYMFSLGARLEVNLMIRQSRTAVATSLFSIILPLGMGAGLAYFLFSGLAGPKANQFTFMLTVGTAMSITAFPVLARLLTEKDMLKTKIGTLALTCAAVNDVIAWCLLAVVVATIHAAWPGSALFTIGLTLLYLIVMLAVIRPLLAFIAKRLHSKTSLMTITIILLLLSAYTTNAIGIHPVFGAFLLGVILPRDALFIEQVNNADQVNNVLFLPLFFVYSGLRTQIGLINTPGLWFISLVVLLIACAGKISGGALGAYFVGHTSWKDALSLGLLMNTRGLVELIVLNIGLDLGALSPTIFAMLVLMALLTTMMASPCIAVLDKQVRSSGKLHEQSAQQI